MPFFLKYKNWIIAILVLGLLAISIYVFANKSKATKDQTPSCPGSFTINPFGNLIENAVARTYSMTNGKYYVANSAGYLGYGIQLAPKEISKEEFMKACDAFKSQQSGTPA